MLASQALYLFTETSLYFSNTTQKTVKGRSEKCYAKKKVKISLENQKFCYVPESKPRLRDWEVEQPVR